MHKGILLSTSGFQSGAIQFAKVHGIALIQVYDQSCHKVSHSAGAEVAIDDKDPIKYIEDHWPPHRAICFTERTEEPIVLFPTTEIVNEISPVLPSSFIFPKRLSLLSCLNCKSRSW